MDICGLCDRQCGWSVLNPQHCPPRSLPCDQLAHCRPCLVGRPEMPRIKIPDVIFHRDKLQPACIRDHNTDGFTAKFYYLLAHGKALLPRLGADHSNRATFKEKTASRSHSPGANAKVFRCATMGMRAPESRDAGVVKHGSLLRQGPAGCCPGWFKVSAPALAIREQPQDRIDHQFSQLNLAIRAK